MGETQPPRKPSSKFWNDFSEAEAFHNPQHFEHRATDLMFLSNTSRVQFCLISLSVRRWRWLKRLLLLLPYRKMAHYACQRQIDEMLVKLKGLGSFGRKEPFFYPSRIFMDGWRSFLFWHTVLKSNGKFAVSKHDLSEPFVLDLLTFSLLMTSSDQRSLKPLMKSKEGELT